MEVLKSKHKITAHFLITKTTNGRNSLRCKTSSEGIDARFINKKECAFINKLASFFFV